MLFNPELSPTTQRADIDFGTLRIGESAIKQLQLSNTSTKATRKVAVRQSIATPMTSNIPDKEFERDIPPGQKLEINFTFAPVKPGSYGPKNQEIAISSSALPRGRSGVGFCLKGICEDRQVLFGKVPVGTTKTQKIDVRNRWGEKATVNLSTKTPFSIDPVHFDLDPNQTNNDIEVYFAPKTAVVAAEILNVKITFASGKESKEEITLGGTGVNK
jgi:hypothetical protein